MQVASATELATLAERFENLTNGVNFGAATSWSNKTPQPKIMLKITFKFLCIFILLGVVNLKADPDPRHGK